VTKSHDEAFLRTLLSLLLEHVVEGIHVTDADGYTLYYNDPAARIDGLRPEDAIGKHVLEMFPSLDAGTSTILQVLQGKKVPKQEQKIRNMYGSTIFLESNTIPLRLNRQIIGALDISRDLTRVKELADKVVDLQSVVNEYRNRRQRTGERATYVLDDIIGHDPAILEVKNKALRAARTDSTILVSGETGTGKELLVQSIHNASPRRDGPFISQNCAALPATLIEGILFGTVKGSFTGAENRPGLVELADGGTLLLDEITCLDLELQSKLLRFLQDGFVRRIGDSHIHRVNVRIIASTNVSPQTAMEDRIMRPDLYYRLNVVSITMPPLRERVQDIPLLADHFLAELNHKLGMKIRGLAPEVKQLFGAYEWPGNVRELRATIEGAMNSCEDEYLAVKYLPANLIGKARQANHPERGTEENLNLPQALASTEAMLINRAMEQTHNNISQAAKLLGIPRQTLQYKLQARGAGQEL